MSNLPKRKKILASLFIGSILVILIFVFSPKKEKNILPPNLKDPSQNTYSQSPFADPFKKSQPEWPEFLLVKNFYLRATSPAFIVTPQVLGALIGGFETEDVQKIIVEYAVEPGDTLGSVSQKFNIDLPTLLWANNLNQNSIIQPGQKLIVPPVSGVIHHVKAGDTLSEIAEKYNGKTEDIISSNELSNENDIFVGDILIVPDGKMPTPKIEYAPQSQEVPIANGYFICPISSPCQITQGLHWYNAVDLSHGKCGEPVFAAAGGKVIKVKYGWSGGAGNNVSISHLNGAVVTVYYHLQNILVFPGQEVLIGEQIGTIGNTGRSTGCHLHFGVVGAKNPFPK